MTERGEDLSEQQNNTGNEGTAEKTADALQKKKRIQRLKTIIIWTVIVLMLLPTILCIILGIEVFKLKNQVEELISTYSSSYDDIGDGGKNNGDYAYASTDDEKEDDLNHPDDNSDGTDKPDGMSNNTDNGTDMPDDLNSDENPYSVDFIENLDLDHTNGIGDHEPGMDPTQDNQDGNISENPDSENPDGDSGPEGPSENGTGDGNPDGEETAGNGNGTENGQPYRDPNGKYYGKKVYLTFDDGPSDNTDKILDILSEYGVKATFFVVGYNDEASKERYKRIVSEGHVLGMHAFEHNYKKIYKSLEDFDKDFTKLWNLLYDTTGVTPKVYRFPGGSLMRKKDIDKYNNYLVQRGVTYYDWNVVNGDAEGVDYTDKQLIDNVLNGVLNRKTSIVLMHDGYGKAKTVKTLPAILDELISGGAELLPIDDNTPLIRQVKPKSSN